MSEIKVNKISPRSGTTVTLGDSGDTIALATGASQTGFGRTGTVDWQTSIKTAATFTPTNGEGYFVDTSSNAVTANLPAGSVGAIVAFKDYAQNFDTNALTIAANGSEKIEGITDDLVLTTEGLAVTLVYGDATKGWQAINSNEVTNAIKFVAATGGTVTTVCTNFKVHTFTGPGSFTVNCAGSGSGSNKVDYLVVAGGGGGTTQHSGGGGGGGFRASFPSPGCNAGTETVAAQTYTVTVGGGGAAQSSGPNQGGTATPGVNSSWASITSNGGGGGGGFDGNPSAGVAGASGGSGGGGGSAGGPGAQAPPVAAGGAGNTPAQSSPASPVQGHSGGSGAGHESGGGGGGGAAAVGGNSAGGTGGNAGAGGAGKQNNIDTNNYYWSGGGGGGSHSNTAGAGGIGGGGAGGSPSSASGGGSAINAGGNNSGATAGAGGTNSGGGGGAAANSSTAGSAGGSGIVILRYKFQ